MSTEFSKKLERMFDPKGKLADAVKRHIVSRRAEESPSDNSYDALDGSHRFLIDRDALRWPAKSPPPNQQLSL
jgi:hypothetical protein